MDHERLEAAIRHFYGWDSPVEFPLIEIVGDPRRIKVSFGHCSDPKSKATLSFPAKGLLAAIEQMESRVRAKDLIAQGKV